VKLMFALMALAVVACIIQNWWDKRQ